MKSTILALAFNLFSVHGLHLSSSRIEGRVATGGSASLVDYSIGTSMPKSFRRCDLDVAGDLDFTRGSVVQGAACVLGAVRTKDVGFAFPAQSSLDVDIVEAAREAEDLSRYLAGVSPDVTVPPTHSTGTPLVLRGFRSRLNTFEVPATALRGASGIEIRVPRGSTVLINVRGSYVEVRSLGTTLEGTTADRILWNFNGARQLTLANVLVEGSVLAPHAKLGFADGRVNGTVIVDEARGNGFYSHRPFIGELLP